MESTICLKPLSLGILEFLYDKPSIMAKDIASALSLGTRQVDAAVTKSLVRHGFVVREYQLSKVLKREHSEIKITERGKKYIEQRLKLTKE